jgi:AAA15 family ATPase/GTPase
MIQNLTIKNFKAHKSTEMKELANVNILLGKNNSGKTGVLEALLLLSLPSSPNKVLMRLNELRGYGTGEDSGEIWDSLFHNWDRSKEISIEINETPNKSVIISNMKESVGRILNIRSIIGEKDKSSNSIGTIGTSDFIEVTKGLQFMFQLSDGETHKKEYREITNLMNISMIKKDDNLNLKRDQAIVFIPARNISNSESEAISYSQLAIENRHDKVVDILGILEPNLERLFVAATKKGSVIYGDIGIDRPIPLPLMGDGILHVLSIALAMENSQNGLVLIDEIENGLHYSVLTDIWKMIFQTSQKLNVQVFVATHSDECLKAAYEAVESLGCYDNLKLYRFDKTKDGTRVVDYTANELYTAIASEQEVR